MHIENLRQSRSFGWTVNGKAILACRPENFQNKRNVLRARPKFPTGISKRKIVFHLLFLPVPGPAPIVKLVPDSL